MGDDDVLRSSEPIVRCEFVKMAVEFMDREAGE